MTPFTFNKKPEPKTCSCSGGCCEPHNATSGGVQVLGGGCKNCHKLMENAEQALKALGMDGPVELVSDPSEIAARGVMSTPALVVDGKVVSTGRVLTADQTAEAIRKVRA